MRQLTSSAFLVATPDKWGHANDAVATLGAAKLERQGNASNTSHVIEACWVRPRKNLTFPSLISKSVFKPVKAELKDILQIKVGHPLLNKTKRFKSCAVVGSSSELVGRRLGAAIDSFQVVIRVNRLPSSALFEDFGRRTDMFAANCLIKAFGIGADKRGNTLIQGGNTTNCSVGDPCHFQAAIFKGCSKNKKTHPDWVQGRYGVAEFGGWILKGMVHFQDRCSFSTGFRTLLNFMPICKTLRLFGFGSPLGRRPNCTSSVDGHGDVEHHHWYPWEHEVLARVATPRREPQTRLPGAAEAAEWLLDHPFLRESKRTVVWK